MSPASDRGSITRRARLLEMRDDLLARVTEAREVAPGDPRSTDDRPYRPRPTLKGNPKTRDPNQAITHTKYPGFGATSLSRHE